MTDEQMIELGSTRISLRRILKEVDDKTSKQEHIQDFMETIGEKKLDKEFSELIEKKNVMGYTVERLMESFEKSISLLTVITVVAGATIGEIEENDNEVITEQTKEIGHMILTMLLSKVSTFANNTKSELGLNDYMMWFPSKEK